ncbi:hypothetical protein [Pseudomonas sp. FP1742]|uniref:hypothetical protein n=1 Tax=Pseudomonas sp. FP1742 TaxID=2954079 RepID=UPI00273438B8|nr:hypothetical protein [Pseudomonas sp. FP1742]WLG48387.1 hypothetical protein PSH64_16710 [Pseudomonas sp. FP1742]
MLQRLDYKPSLKQRGGHGGFFHYVTAATEALAWVRFGRLLAAPCIWPVKSAQGA